MTAVTVGGGLAFALCDCGGGSGGGVSGRKAGGTPAGRVRPYAHARARPLTRPLSSAPVVHRTAVVYTVLFSAGPSPQRGVGVGGLISLSVSTAAALAHTDPPTAHPFVHFACMFVCPSCTGITAIARDARGGRRNGACALKTRGGVGGGGGGFRRVFSPFFMYSTLLFPSPYSSSHSFSTPPNTTPPWNPYERFLYGYTYLRSRCAHPPGRKKNMKKYKTKTNEGGKK